MSTYLKQASWAIFHSIHLWIFVLISFWVGGVVAPCSAFSQTADISNPSTIEGDDSEGTVLLTPTFIHGKVYYSPNDSMFQDATKRSSDKEISQHVLGADSEVQVLYLTHPIPNGSQVRIYPNTSLILKGMVQNQLWGTIKVFPNSMFEYHANESSLRIVLHWGEMIIQMVHGASLPLTTTQNLLIETKTMQIASSFLCASIQSTVTKLPEQITLFAGTAQVKDRLSDSLLSISMGTHYIYPHQSNRKTAPSPSLKSISLDQIADLWKMDQKRFHWRMEPFPYLKEVGNIYNLQKEIGYLEAYHEKIRPYLESNTVEERLAEIKSDLLHYKAQVNQVYFTINHHQSYSTTIPADTATPVLGSLYLTTSQALLRTTDGDHWYPVTIIQPEYWTTDVVFYKGKYYCGIMRSSPLRCQGLAVSEDGITWSSHPGYLETYATPLQFKVHEDVLYIVCKDSDWVRTSENGIEGIYSTVDGVDFKEDPASDILNESETFSLSLTPFESTQPLTIKDPTSEDTTPLEEASPEDPPKDSLPFEVLTDEPIGQIHQQMYHISGKQLWAKGGLSERDESIDDDSSKNTSFWEEVRFDIPPDWAKIPEQQPLKNYLIYFNGQYLFYDQHHLYSSQDGLSFKQRKALESGMTLGHFVHIPPQP